MRTSLPGTTDGTSPPQTECPRENAGGFSGVMQDQIHGMASFDDDPYSSHTAAVISQTLRHQQQHQQQQGYGQQADTSHHPTQLQSVFGGSPHLITHHQMSGDGFAEHGVMGADHIAPPAHHHQQDIVSLGAAAGRRPDLPQWIVDSGEAPHTPPDPSSSHVTFLPPPPMQRLTPPSARPQPGEVMGEGSFMTQQSADFMRFQPSANFRQLPKPKRSSKKANASGKPKGTPGRKRKVPDYELSPAEANRRHIRRERNKIAAAKCRNRRRELTDRLQGETDVLENELHNLNQEVQSLLQEKDQLEFILASHAPQCKASTSRDQPAPSLVPPTFAADPAFTPDPTSFTHHIFPATSTSDHVSERRRHDNADPTEARFGAMSLGMLEAVEDDDAAPMNTPVCTLVTPSLQATNYPVFTFPSTHLAPDSFGVKTEFSSSGKGMPPPPPYGASSSSYPAHPHSSYPSHPHSSCASQLRQRSSSSSSSHHSYDSLQSPKLLTL